ncbi:hypothetical protein [Liquorilactobacillus mali]|uniref:hypothetical protein n=1 Tax=Liquorilactobacillus mali TaxID=1618 RepID=UPI002952ADB1|nr:hypothetical protein [Liquorilactobacillus mali]MDV7758875.1 hypothetical protein [Liquorilactobacillus mali]
MLFNNKHIAGILEDRGLSELNDDSLWQVKNILNELDDEQLLRNSKKIISSDYGNEKAIATYLRAIVEQNWVLLAQNDKILKSLQSQDEAPKEK